MNRAKILKHLEHLESRLLLFTNTAFDVINLPAEQRDFPNINGNGINIAVIDSGSNNAPYIKAAITVIPNSSTQDLINHGSFIESEIHIIAPNAGIYSIKALNDDGSGDASIGGEKSIQWVLDNYQKYHISIVNYSLEYTKDDPIIDNDFEQLYKDGVTICVAAGNLQATFPNILNAAANNPHVISVGATWTQFVNNFTLNGAIDYQTQTDKIAAYSQRADNLSILAPGDVHIDNLKDSIGTSMACGLVSGAVALLQQAHCNTILQTLRATGKKIFDSDTTLDNVKHTDEVFSRLDIDAAIRSILPQTSWPQPTETSFITSLYEHVLNRAPESQGLNYWLHSNLSNADITIDFWNSQEHKKLTVNAAELYESLLNRSGDSQGLAYFADKTEDFIAETMLSSAEFFNDSANYL